LSTLLFLLGSAWAGCCSSMNALIAARVLQGIGGGGITPLGQVILAQNHDLASRAKLQSALVAVWGIASIGGPPLGGYLVSFASWRWIFFLNLPFGLLGMLAVALYLPSMPSALRRAFDGLGFTLFLIAYSCLLAACESLRGSTVQLSAVTWTLTAVLLALLWRYESRQSDPFFPIHLRQHPVFARTFWLAPLIGVGAFGGISYLPLYFQGVLGQSASESGHSMLPFLLAWSGSASFAARLFLRKGPRFCVVIACVAITLGFLGLCFIPTDPWLLFFCECGVGIGGGLSFSPLMLSVQAEVPAAVLGTATSAVVFLRMVGASLGTSLMGIFLPAHSETLAASSVLGPALQKAFILGEVCAAAALVLSLTLPNEAPPKDV
ncbi:unnamed protein product, partial [Phaeothamnion confervicola]